MVDVKVKTVVPISPELQYRNILEWLYTQDGNHSNKNEWREELIKILRFNILRQE